MQVISKVLADLDIKEDPQRIADMIEWASEAVEKIGSVKQLERAVSGVDGEEYLEIKNSQAKLPFGLFRLNQVGYSTSTNGPWFPMKVSQSSFNKWSESGTSPYDVSDMVVKDADMIEMVKILYQKYEENPVYAWFSKVDYEKALEILNTNQNVRTLLSNMIKRNTGNNTKVDNSNLVYSIKPGYINTNVSSGYLKLSYDRQITDENGFLMIPDKLSYIEAVYWYIVMKLSYPEWRSGKIRTDIYIDAKTSWAFYCKQAYAESMMPNQDEMETIKNVWNRLLPDMTADNDFYSNISSREVVYNKNR
jgi:hypothetical protein